ncbi:MAG: AAA domain-containing protein [Alloprevotella sp.]
MRWHYRSRHEHLIAFSNIKIYNNHLITFPSSTESALDFGVEYVYVKEGVYDRGGKKNNTAEAEKVADLVFEHFKKHPNRSLGVVTFSEAQQNTVEAAIYKKRKEKPNFNQFFIEEKEESFFIKNLENVQGDERDTIIFSIGYAKDSNGIMYMNFGPLSREDGYRRLNVAITRAKYNVKLVGSIVPTDIDLEKVTSEGVKLLRLYIEFAQQGIIALEKEPREDSESQCESPFEEAVYDFLLSKGYKVKPQVGCSGFRIDMAVKHPTQSGRYVIGIECDGATYHSSRTARERDRLRQTVLEDMGWTIYRIWSTDWIKHQEAEEEKLINAVEDALKRANNESEDHSVPGKSDGDVEAAFPTIAIEEIESSRGCDNGYHFDTYERASIELLDGSGRKKESYEVILDVVLCEQPIHIDELCRRVALLYGRQKVTSKVYGEVIYALRYKLGDRIVQDGNFFRTKDFCGLKVRIPNPADDYYRREITYICDDELGLAMKTIAQHSCGITPDDLIIATAREFGFKRTGDSIRYSLCKVYQHLLRNNEVTEVEGKICVV